jgi:hypothetical protein
MNNLKQKALLLGADYFGFSSRKGKKYMVIYKDKKIHFGSEIGSTFIDHHDENKRRNWRARHEKILNKYGYPVYLIKESPSWWSYNLLW